MVCQDPRSLYPLTLFFCACAGKVLVPGCVRDLGKVSRPIFEADAVVLASRRLLEIWGGHVSRLVGNLPSTGLQSITLLCSIDVNIGWIAHVKVKQHVVFEIL